MAPSLAALSLNGLFLQSACALQEVKPKLWIAVVIWTARSEAFKGASASGFACWTACQWLQRCKRLWGPWRCHVHRGLVQYLAAAAGDLQQAGGRVQEGAQKALH